MFNMQSLERIPLTLHLSDCLPSAAEFKSHFSAYGTITEAVIMVDYSTGRSRGFG
jgi:hypothetical protein